MEKDAKIFVSIRFLSLEEKTVKRIIQDWLVFARILFKPTAIGANQQGWQPFSLGDCLRLIQQNCGKEEFSLRITDGQNESNFHFQKGKMLEQHLLDAQLFQKHRQMILNYTEVQMKLGLCAYIRDYQEYLYHNQESLTARLAFQSYEEIEKLPKLRLPSGQVVVDCNQFAGYDLYHGGCCLTSCWRMYFGPTYQQILPLEIIQDVQQVEQARWLSNDVLLVELYRDPFRWQETRNLAFQRLFRDQIGIDQLAWTNGTGILREPYIEFSRSKGVIQTVQYQNDDFQPTTKKQATHFVTRVFDLQKKQHHVKRVKGSLNTKAYFPLVDENRMRMASKVSLNPGLTLDNGLAAYEFYLRNHLEIPLITQDQSYQEYLVLLKVYLPSEYAKDIPYDALKSRMSDVKFSRLKKRRKRYFVDLNKGENHLRVMFLEQSELENEKNVWGEFDGGTSI